MRQFRTWSTTALLFLGLAAFAQPPAPNLIDVHEHFDGEAGVLEQILAKLNAADGLGILLTTPKGLPEASSFVRQHPGRFIGFGEFSSTIPPFSTASTNFIKQDFVDWEKSPQARKTSLGGFRPSCQRFLPARTHAQF
jgi:hypothetical protein